MKSNQANNVLRLSFGADPELAIYDNERQKMVSAIPVIGHDKDNPIMLGKDIKFYHDNILSEMAFPPSETVAKMVDSFRGVFQKASKQLGKRYKLVPKSAHLFDDEALSDPRALESGCSPTLAVYRKEQNPPSIEKNKTLLLCLKTRGDLPVVIFILAIEIMLINMMVT